MQYDSREKSYKKGIRNTFIDYMRRLQNTEKGIAMFILDNL